MRKKYLYGVIFAVCCVVCAVAYWPVLTNNYAYNDDYPIFDAIQSGHSPEWRHLVLDQGRPLAGAINHQLLSGLDSIDQLKYVRLLSVFSLALFASWVACLLLRNGFSEEIALVIACLVVTSPPFAVYASWTILVSSSFSSILALAGGYLIHSSICKRNGRIVAPECLAGCALIFCVLCIYQSVALIALLPIVLPALRKAQAGEPLLRDFLLALGAVLATLMFYRLSYQICLWMLDGAGTQSNRSDLLLSPVAKLIYFGQVLLSGMQGWSGFAGPATGWFMAAIFAALVSIGFMGIPRSHRWSWLMVLFISLPLSMLPILVIAESDLQYRTQSATQMLLLVFAGTGLAQLQQLSVIQSATLQRTIAVLMVAVSAATAHYQVYQGIVEPNRRELQAFREEVAKMTSTDLDSFIFKSPQPAWLNKNLRSEFGVIASPAWWNTRAILRLLLVEHFPEHQELRQMSAWTLNVKSAHSNQSGQAVVLDVFSALHAGEYQLSSHPFLGEIKVLPSGWTQSNWLGNFHFDGGHGMWHNRLGPMFFSHSEQGDTYFMQFSLGLFRTHEGIFPQLLLEDETVFILDLHFWQTID